MFSILQTSHNFQTWNTQPQIRFILILCDLGWLYTCFRKFFSYCFCLSNILQISSNFQIWYIPIPNPLYTSFRWLRMIRYKNFGLCRRKETWVNLKKNVSRASIDVICVWARFVAETPLSFRLTMLLTLRQQKCPHQINLWAKKTFLSIKSTLAESPFHPWPSSPRQNLHFYQCLICFMARNYFYKLKYSCWQNKTSPHVKFYTCFRKCF